MGDDIMTSGRHDARQEIRDMRGSPSVRRHWLIRAGRAPLRTGAGFDVHMAAAIIAVAVSIVAPHVARAARMTPQAELERAIAGRTQGEPVDCIPLIQIRSTKIINHTAIIFEMEGRTIYVNTPPNGASQLDDRYTLVIDTHTPQLCSVDTLKLRDMSLRADMGFVGLGKFIPYTRK